MCKIPFIFFTVLLFFSCANKNEVPFCVTYKVLVHSFKPCQVLIIYKDSTDYKMVETEINGTWTQEVLLSPDDMASLLVMRQYNRNSDVDDTSDGVLFGKDKGTFTGKIIHEKKTVSEYNVGVVQISLSPSDIK